MLDYKSSGVDYDLLYAFKRNAQEAAERTDYNIARFGAKVIRETRGRSAFAIELKPSSRPVLILILSKVNAGIETKNLVADKMYRLTKVPYYYNVAQDAVAMIVNDAISVGTLPVVVNMHLAVGSSDWFSKNQANADALILGWEHACHLARCVWGGGETATLKDIIYKNMCELSGSTFGLAGVYEQFVSEENICDGDAIVILESSGIHANGLTLVRDIAKKLPDTYLTKLENGLTFGEEILKPTPIYVGVIEDCFNAGVKIHYAENITGHGWRKLMCPNRPFNYVIEKLPDTQTIFKFIQKVADMSDYEAYATFNMGAGYALYVDVEDVSTVIKIAQKNSIKAYHAGHITKSRDTKQVLILPKGIKYGGGTLSIR